MSLQLWFPFTHNFQNQGISDGTITNENVTLKDTVAQISSKSAFFNEGNRLIITNTNTFLKNNTKEFSIAFWAKLPTSGGYMTLFCDRTSTGEGVSLFWNPSELGFRFDGGGSASGQTFFQFDSASDLPTDWTHYCFVYTNKYKKVYKNGVLWKTAKLTSSLGHIANSIYIGTSANNTDTHENNDKNYLTNTYLNDYRIYNHELSIREIKELSQRLLIHYTFFDNSTSTNLFDMPRLISAAPTSRCTATNYGLNGLLLCDAAGKGDPYIGTAYQNGGTYGTNYIINVLENTTYTLSWTHVSGPEMSKSYISFFNSEGKAINSSYFSITSGIKKVGTRRYYTFTPLAGTKAIHIRFGNGASAADASTSIIDEVCLRQGDVYSFSAPGEGNIVYDNSGNGYDGGLRGRCQLVEETARGIHGLRTLGNPERPNISQSSFIYTDLETLITPTQFTICFVAKLHEWGVQTSGFLTLSSDDQAIAYTTSTVAQYDSIFQLNATGSTTNASMGTNFIKTNEWHHYALRWDGKVWESFRDGIRIQSTAAEFIADPFRYLLLGFNQAGGAGRDADITWGDFKLYMTALSQEEIAKENSIMQRILHNGLEETIVYDECDITSSKISRKGIHSCNNISEIIELTDGSCWIQLSHHNNQNQTNWFPTPTKDESGKITNYDYENNFIYKNDECWAAFHLLKDNNFKLDKNEEFYEFMALEELSNGNVAIFRWSQTVNPMNATWDQMKPNATTKLYTYNTDGYNAPGDENGGMYRYENSNSDMDTSFFVIANKTKSNWYGAFGARKNWDPNGNPAFCKRGTKGIFDLYMRINPDMKKYREFKNGILMPTTITEI